MVDALERSKNLYPLSMDKSSSFLASSADIIKNSLIDGRLLFWRAIIYHLSELMFGIKFYVTAVKRYPATEIAHIKNHAQE